MKGRILIVDDDAAMTEVLVEGLARRGFVAIGHTRGGAALQQLATEAFDAVVTDLRMPDMGGIELCEHIAGRRPDVPVIAITAFGSLETAVQAIRAGAYDFITKPLDIDALELALNRAVQHRALREEVRQLRRAVEDTHRFDDLVGSSAPMLALYELLERVAESDASVVVTGETGTGKEVVARALHRHGRRKGGPFMAINCAAMPESLLEAELFGHVRGAFTDARAERKGLLRVATGGTLFLDEVGDMPPSVQPKLLRALQERVVRPVGGDGEHPFDVRVVAATNRDLETAVEEGRFREDLYFRLNVIHVDLPPLRERGGDILVLAQLFLVELADRAGKGVRGISRPAAERLLSYRWPGNVRELRNCIERAVALTRHEELMIEDLPEKVRTPKASASLVVSDDPSDLVTMDEVERRYILRVLESTSGNKRAAAKILGFDRKTLYRKMQRYGVE